MIIFIKEKKAEEFYKITKKKKERVEVVLRRKKTNQFKSFKFSLYKNHLSI